MAELGTELDITTSDRGLTLVGDVDAHTAPLLQHALAEAQTPHDGDLVLDVRAVRFMDSSGLRILIAATDAARANCGDLVLLGPTSTVARLIEVSGLAEHLTVTSELG